MKSVKIQWSHKFFFPSILMFIFFQFPPEFDCGDGEGIDLKLSNKVYNKLKRHSDAENKRHQKLHEKKEHSTAVCIFKKI